MKPWMTPYIAALRDEVTSEQQRRVDTNHHHNVGSPFAQKLVEAAGLPYIGEKRARDLVKAILTTTPPPPTDPEDRSPTDLDEVFAHKEAVFERAMRKVPPETVVELPSTPTGILVFGDPHLDSDGCDIKLLRSHVKLVQETPGLYGALIGDLLNNWVGRLAREYAHQSCNTEEAMMLLRWLLNSVPWMWSVMGNHDRWNNGVQLYDLLLERANVTASSEFDVKLALGSGDHEPVRIWARHNFKGRSMYHNVHGLLRATREHDYPADLYVQGHNHTWGVMQGERDSGRCFTVAQVGTYKRVDSYALSLGYSVDNAGQAMLVVVDPTAHGLERCRTFFDIRLGLEVLKVLRSR